jgi:ADP-heptose:LPS heptosyltransferase
MPASGLGPPCACCAEVNRILVLSLSGIGDTLMATPLFHELGTQFPEAEVEALVLWPGARQVLLGNPHVDEIWQHDFLKSSRLASLAFLWRLRRRGYDLTLNTHTQGRRGYRLISRLIGAPTRLSHEYENHGFLDTWLVTQTLPQDYQVHVMDNNARLLGLLGLAPRLTEPGYELFLSPDELRWAETWAAQRRSAGQRWLGIHAGSGGTKNLALRRWPVTRFAGLLKRIEESRPDIVPVFFGGPEEAPIHEELRRLGAEFIEAETPSLRHAAALVARCDMFLSVDTVFMHLAAAVGVPFQLVIETPTLNPPVYPRRPDWLLIPNPAIGGRHLDFYRYDGRDIAGTPDEIRRMMEAVTIDAVWDRLLPIFG